MHWKLFNKIYTLLYRLLKEVREAGIPTGIDDGASNILNELIRDIESWFHDSNMSLDENRHESGNTDNDLNTGDTDNDLNARVVTLE